jgi:hypothetical protein
MKIGSMIPPNIENRPVHSAVNVPIYFAKIQPVQVGVHSMGWSGL